MSELTDKILALSHLYSIEIGERLSCSPRYVRKVLRKAGLNHPAGPRKGEHNPAWVGGRMVDLDGYVVLRNAGFRMSEHRHVYAAATGMPLARLAVVDHIDRITIHNDISNLRGFASNAAHLRDTLHMQTPQHSKSGRANMTSKGKKRLVGGSPTVDTYQLRKVRGDVRLRAILHAVRELGIGHPCLLGTLHWLEKSGIDPRSRRSLVRGWDGLMSRYDADLAQ